jgi:hypothetical protein
LPSEDTVRFRARVVAQTFGGASDFMEIVCPDGQSSANSRPRGTSMEGEQRFEFDLRDAVAVRTTGSAAPAAGEPPDDTSSSGTPPGGQCI